MTCRDRVLSREEAFDFHRSFTGGLSPFFHQSTTLTIGDTHLQRGIINAIVEIPNLSTGGLTQSISRRN